MQFHFKNFKKRFSAFKFSPKLWDKPARTALGPFLRLWPTQTFSALGSSMTSFALVIWAYEQSGSALSTALLSICSYAPYVLLSIFDGGLSDRWNKKATMLICDAAAALSTVGVLVLLSTDALCVWCVGAVLGWLPIPLGYLLDGALIDTAFEPFMAVQTPESLFCCLFGTGKGSGARFCFLSSASSASPFFSASAAASLSAGWKRTTKIKKLNQTTNIT